MPFINFVRNFVRPTMVQKIANLHSSWRNRWLRRCWLQYWLSTAVNETLSTSLTYWNITSASLSTTWAHFWVYYQFFNSHFSIFLATAAQFKLQLLVMEALRHNLKLTRHLLSWSEFGPPLISLFLLLEIFTLTTQIQNLGILYFSLPDFPIPSYKTLI